MLNMMFIEKTNIGAPSAALGPLRRSARPALHPRISSSSRRPLIYAPSPFPTFRPLHRSSTTAAASPQHHQQIEQQEQLLSEFLGWLIANGVEGVGPEGSIGLFSGDGGERGIAALRPIRRGETLARIPLRLAIIEDLSMESSDPVNSQNATNSDSNGRETKALQQPWSVRLACKLLQYKAQGADCPWAPYLAVLPTHVPTPVLNLSWEDAKAISYAPARRQLDAASWLVASSWNSLGSSPRSQNDSEEASPSSSSSAPSSPAPAFSRDEFEWALSVVHSRTFCVAAARGGPGPRMLIPFIDMLNHCGDEDVAAPGAPGPTPFAADSVRWDVVSKLGGEQFMVLTATRDIQQVGEELTLSYGERPNEDFFLHYGFVPRRNPHDAVALFPTIEDAIDWHLQRYIPLGALSPAQLQTAISVAYTAAAAAEEESGQDANKAAAALAALSESEAEAVRAERAAIKLMSRGRVDGRLAAALMALHAAARVAGGPGVAVHSEEHVKEAVKSRAVEVLREIYEAGGARLESDLEKLAGWEGADGQHGFAIMAAHYATAIASSPAAAEVNENGGGKSAETGGVLDAGIGEEDAALLAALQAAAPVGAAAASTAAADVLETCDSGSQENRDVPVTVLMYRAYKAMILWDAILA